jgi:hypothetical protein
MRFVNSTLSSEPLTLTHPKSLGAAAAAIRDFVWRSTARRFTDAFDPPGSVGVYFVSPAAPDNILTECMRRLVEAVVLRAIRLT